MSPAGNRLTRRAFLALGAVTIGAIGGLAGIAGAATRERPNDQRVSLGDLTLVVRADPWRLSLLGPDGVTLWEESEDAPLGFRTLDGQIRRARRLASFNVVGIDAVQLVAETDDPSGAAISLEVRGINRKTLRMTVIPDDTSHVTAIIGGFKTTPDERFVGF